MPVLRRILDRRSVENPGRPLTSSSLIDILGSPQSSAGVSITQDTVLGIPAVWRSVNLLAGTAASLPLKSFKDDSRERIVVPVLDSPHPDMTRFEFWEWIYVSLLLWGNAYAQKVYDGMGRIVELWPIMPSDIKVGRSAPWDANPSGKVFDVTTSGSRKAWTPHEVFHIPGLGYDGICGVSPLRLARQGFGLALAAEEFGARFFGSGSMLGGVLQTEQRLDQPAADALKERWRSKMAGLNHSHEVAVLDSGATFQQVGIPPGDAQFLESRSFQVEEIARWFGLPPHMIGAVTKTSSWGTGIEQQSIGFVVYTLRSQWLTRVEQRVEKELQPVGTYSRYIVEGLLRGDSKARAAFYQTMVAIRAMNPNEVRDLEDREPYEGGDEYLNPHITVAPTPMEEPNADDNG